MNYILYLGPDDFRGLIGMPEEPKYSVQYHFEKEWVPFVAKYNKQVASLKANAPKIVNPDILLTYAEGGEVYFQSNTGEILLKDKELILELPEGFEFKKQVMCQDYTCNDGKCIECKSLGTVLRIVKTEPKKNVILGKNSCIHRDGNLQIGHVKTEVKDTTKKAVYVKGYYNSDDLRKLATELDLESK